MKFLIPALDMQPVLLRSEEATTASQLLLLAKNACGGIMLPQDVHVNGGTASHNQVIMKTKSSIMERKS